MGEGSAEAGRARPAVVALLLVLAVCAGTLGAAAVVFRDTVVDGREFADRTVTALSTPAAREVIGAQVADQIVGQVPEAVAVRPLIETAVQGALSTAAFRRILAAAVRDLHDTVLADRSDTVTLRLVDVVLVAKAQLAAVSPQLAALIPDGLTDALVSVSAESWDVDAVQLFDRARLAAFLGPLLALAFLAGYLALARDRRRGLVVVGAVLAAVGAALLALTGLLRPLVLARFTDPDARTVAAAVWSELTGGVGPLALGLATAGAGLATLVALVGHGMRPADLVARAGVLVRVPAGRRARAAWCAGCVTVGVLLLLDGPRLARVGLAALGAAAVLVGLSEAVRLVGPPRRTPAVARARHRPLRHLRPVVAAALVVAGVAGAGVAIDRSGGTTPTGASADPRCNGSVLLCSRRFDQVALAATHNSMAAADAGFLEGNQPHGILAQLDAGYRGLLIDTYYGLSSPGSSVVVTDRTPLTAAQRRAQVADVGEAAVRAAEELRRRSRTTGGSRGLYLCHAACEIGATPLGPQLVAIRGWLEAHPREVLVIFIQDAVTPQDTVDAFRAAGLDRYAHTQPAGEAWPTLEEMIDGGRRLLVMAEQDAGAAAWYQSGFALTQETPYSFGSVDAFSCGLNRGRSDSPLFLVNHFVTPASVTAAARANSRVVLTERLRRCQRERHHIPTLVAVDFYDRGDVVAAVAELNGVTPP